jgi:hypothetical protein
VTRYTLTVPATLNDGTLVPLAEIERIEARLIEIAGGFTLTHGIGAYRGEAQTYSEPVRLYAVDTETAEYVAAPLRMLAEYVALALDQEAVYLTSQEVNARLIYRPNVLA